MKGPQWMVLIALLWWPASAVGAEHGPGAILERLWSDPFLGRATIAAKVVDIETGAPVWERDPDRLLLPASTVKLVTAMAVLEHMDPNEGIQTRLLATGPIEDGVLRGDLVVLGAGDPSLGAPPPLGEGPEALLAAWSRAVHEAGVRRVEGDLVADARLFPPRAHLPGWSVDDLHAAYAAPVTALALHHNQATATLMPATVEGEQALLAVRPLPACLPVDAVVQTGAPRSKPHLVFERLPGRAEVRVRGSLPLQGGPAGRRLALPDPAACLVQGFWEALAAEGVELDGRPRVAGEHDPDPVGQALHIHHSPPLRELLRHTLVSSNNLYAESLLRLLDPQSEVPGEAAFAALFRAAGVPDDAWRLVDGSGLSRYDLLAPEALVRLLRHAWRRPWRDELLDLLPAPGDGTLRARLVGGPAEDRVRAKTGSMSGVFNLAGYVTTPDDRVLAFVLLTNGVVQPGTAVRYLQDATLEVLGDQAGPPPRRRLWRPRR